MIAGERASPAATAVDDFMNTRRLTGAIFMGFSPSVLVTTAIVVAACFLNCRAKATARARGAARCRKPCRHRTDRRRSAHLEGWVRGKIDDTIFHSRGTVCVRVFAKSGLEKAEGAGKAGCSMHPQPRTQTKKHTSIVTTGSPNNPAGSSGRRNTGFFHSCQQLVKRLRGGFPSQCLSRSGIES